MGKIKEIAEEISWYAFIVFVMGIAVVISLLLGKFIGENWWIIFIGDIIYFCLLWFFFSRTQKKEFKVKKRLVLLIFILAIILFLATIGLSSIIDPRIILNVVVMFFGSFVVLVLSFPIRRNWKRNLIIDSPLCYS